MKKLRPLSIDSLTYKALHKTGCAIDFMSNIFIKVVFVSIFFIPFINIILLLYAGQDLNETLELRGKAELPIPFIFGIFSVLYSFGFCAIAILKSK